MHVMRSEAQDGGGTGRDEKLSRTLVEGAMSRWYLRRADYGTVGFQLNLSFRHRAGRAVGA